MDVPTGNSGTDALIDFTGDIIRLHIKNGGIYRPVFDMERAARRAQSHDAEEFGA